VKALIITLAATAAMGLALITPTNAEAGQVQVNVHLGVPTVAHHARVTYRPVVVYHPHVIYRPTRHFRHRYYHGHDRHRGFGRHRGSAPIYHHHIFAAPRVIEKIRINPRLQR
jgi:hypothetical protein